MLSPVLHAHLLLPPSLQIETQKRQRRNKHLREDIQVCYIVLTHTYEIFCPAATGAAATVGTATEASTVAQVHAHRVSNFGLGYLFSENLS